MNRKDLLERLKGVFVPMFTPFTPGADSIDEDRLRSNVRYLVENGIRLLNPAGTTGEFWTLTPNEHRRVLQVVIEEAREVDPQVIVVAGTSCPSIKMTIELTQFAADCGAPIVQVTPPYGLPVDHDDLVSYFKLLSEKVDVAIMAYDIPSITGVSLQCDVLDRMCQACPNLVSLKTAALGSSPREFERLVRRFSNRLQVFSATGTYYATFAYMTGVAGITDTLANVAPGFALSLDELARSRQWEEMNRLYQDAFDVLEVELLYGRGGLKEIGHLCGVVDRSARFPMSKSLSADARSDIRNRLSRWSYSRDLVTRQVPTPHISLATSRQSGADGRAFQEARISDDGQL